ncbi:potassium channel family protein [Gephyromycinifex aptenodytis]|uniref:potassium channel family protein n=1 Tax=Gephyromycinifex aptenodytis TaxID=2716227 RepID=UPI00144595EE|nr:potassium channel protein [Gephyromycinifex aptenodytis]
MANPLLVLTTRPWGRQSRRSPLRRATVPVPTRAAATDAVFLVLRRMRTPLIALIVVFAVAVFGLTLIPGQNEQGQPYQMTAFDAFYFMSYTATTIGFGEVPYTFTVPQRLWVVGSIFASVTCWAYSIGAVFSLMQDQAFQEAFATQRFGRKVRGLREEFFIVAGYGQAGRLVAAGLDARGRRLVVIDDDSARIDQLAIDSLTNDVPGLTGDVRDPALLGLAGMGSHLCEGVLALTDDDDANLAIAMSAHLLRPDLPVFCRAEERSGAKAMEDFEPTSIVNPYDHYGAFLVLALKHPFVYRLVTWLMSTPGTELPPLREGLTDGEWVVSADDSFGREVAADLESVGLKVRLVEPGGTQPDVTQAVGLVAGTVNDGANLSLAAHARLTHPDIFIALRQQSDLNAALLGAFEPDSVFVPTELVAREALARITVPMSWSFLEHIIHQDEEWARQMTDLFVQRSGTRSPSSHLVELTDRSAPAVVRWLRHDSLTLGDLIRDPEDRSTPISATPIVLVRDNEITFLPSAETELKAEDKLVLAGRTAGFHVLYETLYSDSMLEYVATGREVPTTWVFRMLMPKSRRPAGS